MTKSNPFSTRFVRPGGIPYIGLEPDEVCELAKRFIGCQMRGQIVGRHGAGKSTLTFPLAQAINNQLQEMGLAQGLDVRRIVIDSSKSIRDSTNWQPTDHTFKKLLVVDGIERLSRWHRLAMLSNLRSRSIGVLVTTHQEILELPVLIQLRPDVKTLMRLVERLAPTTIGQPGFKSHELEQLMESHNGNIRECLMALYDVYETL
ncbi:MAG: hypothetical protein AAFN77_18915 [Planctomycetota bacterium]